MRILYMALGLVLLSSSPASAQGWGTLKGQVVWGEAALPPAVILKVDKDQAHCLEKGPIASQEYVINPKNKGVRWVMVWIAPDNGAGKVALEKKLAIHPALAAIKDKEVVIDQPCCMFETHVVGMREGQTLLI